MRRGARHSGRWWPVALYHTHPASANCSCSAAVDRVGSVWALLSHRGQQNFPFPLVLARSLCLLERKTACPARSCLAQPDLPCLPYLACHFPAPNFHSRPSPDLTFNFLSRRSPFYHQSIIATSSPSTDCAPSTGPSSTLSSRPLLLSAIIFGRRPYYASRPSLGKSPEPPTPRKLHLEIGVVVRAAVSFNGCRASSCTCWPSHL